MPERYKILNENTFRESQAAVKTPNLALTMPLTATYAKRTACVKGQI